MNGINTSTGVYPNVVGNQKMNKAEAIIENSFKITGRGLILELRHFENGLPKDTELSSEETGLCWKMIARVLFDHAVQEQRVFEPESVDYMLLRFETPEKLTKSINEIKEREAKNVFQYFLKPIGHEEKPKNGEKLKINYPQQII